MEIRVYFFLAREQVLKSATFARNHVIWSHRPYYLPRVRPVGLRVHPVVDGGLPELGEGEEDGGDDHGEDEAGDAPAGGLDKKKIWLLLVCLRYFYQCIKKYNQQNMSKLLNFKIESNF